MMAGIRGLLGSCVQALLSRLRPPAAAGVAAASGPFARPLTAAEKQAFRERIRPRETLPATVGDQPAGPVMLDSSTHPPVAPEPFDASHQPGLAIKPAAMVQPVGNVGSSHAGNASQAETPAAIAAERFPASPANRARLRSKYRLAKKTRLSRKPRIAKKPRPARRLHTWHKSAPTAAQFAAASQPAGAMQAEATQHAVRVEAVPVVAPQVGPPAAMPTALLESHARLAITSPDFAAFVRTHHVTTAGELIDDLREVAAIVLLLESRCSELPDQDVACSTLIRINHLLGRVAAMVEHRNNANTVARERRAAENPHDALLQQAGEFR